MSVDYLQVVPYHSNWDIGEPSGNGDYVEIDNENLEKWRVKPGNWKTNLICFNNYK